MRFSQLVYIWLELEGTWVKEFSKLRSMYVITDLGGWEALKISLVQAKVYCLVCMLCLSHL